ncbi:MAG: carboxypeptidase regulatory-like domain-containing protein [Kofleriaceae bacterium]|nr:carboxypeptidase regulatory-like domain-containing protein [Kofleriaceae bacterium]
MSPMYWIRISAAACFLVACGGGETPVIDAGIPDAMPDAMAPDATVALGPMYSGVVNAGAGPLPGATIELSYSGGTVNITTSDTGEFSIRLPLVDTDYQVYIPGPDGFWSHSSWLLDVSEAGRTGLEYALADDPLFEGLSSVLGLPSIEKTVGVVSLDIRVGNLEQQGLGFTFDTPADPIFSFIDGMPLETPHLLGIGDTVLIFTNIAPQTLIPAIPNMGATGCRQLAPASIVRAGSVLTLVVDCN